MNLPADPYMSPSPAETARLSRGEVLISSEPVAGWKTPLMVVRAVIERSPAQVWPVIDRCERYGEFMPRVKSNRVLSRGPSGIVTEMVFSMPFPLKDLRGVTHAEHHEEPDTHYRRSWRLKEGDYARNEGSWDLVPFAGAPERTLVVYRIHVEPRVKIPKKLQSLVQEKTLPQLIEIIRSTVERRLREQGG